MGRFIALWLLLLCGLGALLGGELGAGIGLGLALSSIVAFAAFAERIVRAPHVLEDRELASLKATYRRILEIRGMRLTEAPQIQIYSYPAPNLFFARGIFSRGVLAVSQGTFSFCSESELRSLLEQGLDTINSPWAVWRTVHAAFRTCIFRILPGGSAEFLSGSSFQGFRFKEGLRFALLFPWLKRRSTSSKTTESFVRFERLNQLWPNVPCPGAAALYLFDPESKRMIFGSQESQTLV